MRYISSKKRIITNEFLKRLKELFDNIKKINKKNINNFINY